MKLVPVNEIPDRRKYHKLQALIEEFVNSPYEIARCENVTEEYQNAESAAGSLRTAVRRSKCFGVKVIKRGENIYLAK